MDLFVLYGNRAINSWHKKNRYKLTFFFCIGRHGLERSRGSCWHCVQLRSNWMSSQRSLNGSGRIWSRIAYSISHGKWWIVWWWLIDIITVWIEISFLLRNRWSGKWTQGGNEAQWKKCNTKNNRPMAVSWNNNCYRLVAFILLNILRIICWIG